MTPDNRTQIAEALELIRSAQSNTAAGVDHLMADVIGQAEWRRAYIIAHAAMSAYDRGPTAQHHFGSPADGGRWPTKRDNDYMEVQAAINARLDYLQGSLRAMVTEHKWTSKQADKLLMAHGFESLGPSHRLSAAQRCEQAQRAIETLLSAIEHGDEHIAAVLAS